MGDGAVDKPWTRVVLVIPVMLAHPRVSRCFEKKLQLDVFYVWVGTRTRQISVP